MNARAETVETQRRLATGGFLPTPAPPVRRTVVVRGVEYVVTWDGAHGGAQALGLPLAGDRAAWDDPATRGGWNWRDR